MPEGKLAINLIPKEEAKKKAWDKFLKWVLTYGRYIIIGTEIVVLVAFLFRFKLDRDLKDLSDEVKNKHVMIESFGNLEEQTRALQAYLATIKSLDNQSPSNAQLLTSLSSLTPQDVIYSQLNINSPKVSLSATAFSLGGLSAFLEGMKRSEEFKNVSIESLQEASSGIEFTVTFIYQRS